MVNYSWCKLQSVCLSVCCLSYYYVTPTHIELRKCVWNGGQCALSILLSGRGFISSFLHVWSSTGSFFCCSQSKAFLSYTKTYQVVYTVTAVVLWEMIKKHSVYQTSWLKPQQVWPVIARRAFFFCFLHTTTHRSLKAYCAILVRSFQLSPPGVSTRVTTREHPEADGGTMGEKCPVILPKWRFPRHLGIFYMP